MLTVPGKVAGSSTPTKKLSLACKQIHTSIPCACFFSHKYPFSPLMVAQYPCRACSKNVNINQKAIFCNSCNLWIHSKCNNLTKQDFDRLSKENDDIPFICKCCISDNIPFSNLSNKIF